MSFKNDVPNWSIYTNNKYHMNDVPSDAFSELNGLIRRSVNNSSDLKMILNVMAEIIPCEPVTNWGWDFLVNDITWIINAISKKVEKGRFPIFMDCLSVLVEKGDLLLDELNDYLQDNEIGYRAEYDFNNHVVWKVTQSQLLVEKLDETKDAIVSISQQAYDEIRRAKKSLENHDDERAIKDAVRSCVSAMEAVVKELGEDNDISSATRKLRAEKCWGIDEIVKEGLSIFNTMHRLYPDLRHGSTETSVMTINEAEYWIGRILNYIQYMDKQHRNVEKIN